MTKHIIIWQIKDEYRDRADEIKAAAKEKLEGLNGQIPGMSNIIIRTEGLKSSNGDLLLDGTYDSEEDMNNYSVNPKHVYVADNYIRPYMQVRMCFDYEQ